MVKHCERKQHDINNQYALLNKQIKIENNFYDDYHQNQEHQELPIGLQRVHFQDN